MQKFFYDYQQRIQAGQLMVFGVFLWQYIRMLSSDNCQNGIYLCTICKT